MRGLELSRLEGLLESFAGLRLLVVGDLVLDEYVFGEVHRISPEAPVPVVQVREEAQALGGAGNVARNVVALGARAELCAAVGDDAAGRRVAELVKEQGIDPSGLVVAPDRPTTRKTRVVARAQQVVRFDRESVEPSPLGVDRRLGAALARAIPLVDGAIVEDYGKGLLSPRGAAAVMRRFLAADLPVAVDPKGTVAPWRGAMLLKPNLREAEALSGVAIRSEADLGKAAARLRRQIGGGAVVVTQGAAGMTLFDAEHAGVRVRTASRAVFDVQGAGDTAIAGLALALRAGASLLEAAVLANAAACVVVGKVGTATASAAEVRALLPDAIAAARAPA
jgi:D-beta-D-heptose 7-phosphate kinase/D-beta-D-heptose 1-phosphate adenosyltransferase